LRMLSTRGEGSQRSGDIVKGNFLGSSSNPSDEPAWLKDGLSYQPRCDRGRKKNTGIRGKKEKRLRLMLHVKKARRKWGTG